MIEQHNGNVVLPGEVSQHREKSSNLPPQDGVPIEHGGNRVDRQKNGAMRLEEVFELTEEAALDDLAAAVDRYQPSIVELGAIDVQVIVRIRIEAPMFADTLNAVTH